MLGWLKNLQYFSNVRPSLIALNGFAEVVKETNHTGLWDAKLAWYSVSTIKQIHVYGLEHDLGIHNFRPNLPYLTVEVLANQAKFLQPSCDELYLHLFVQKMFLVASTALWPTSNL